MMAKPKKEPKPRKKPEKAGKTTTGNPKSDVDEPFSQQVCQRIGEMRKERNWTLQQLSEISGVSRSMLSQIERQTANPTLSVAHRISQAFGMSLADLVEPATEKSKIEVTRAKDPLSLFRDDEDVRIRTLSPLHTEKEVEFYELLLKPDACLTSGAHFEGTSEFLTVVKGKLQLTAGDETTILQKGDSARYHADIPHSIKNIGSTKALAFLVDIFQGR